MAAQLTFASIHLLSLLTCQAPATSTNPLLGVWRSHEARTHEEIRKIRNALSEKQRAFLLRPGFFGRMVYLFQKDRTIVAFDGQCQPAVSYRYNISKDGDVSLLLFHPSGDNTLVKMRLEGDELSLNIGGDLFPELNHVREIFRRVTAREIEDLPCIQRLISDRVPHEERRTKSSGKGSGEDAGPRPSK